MIEKLDISWNNDFSNDGYLYFGQRIVEMLNYMTVDLYRAPLLNTVRLIEEYLDIYRTTHNRNQLIYVKAEFIDSFTNDVVLKYKYNSDVMDQLLEKINESSDSVEMFGYLNVTIGPYYLDWCKEYIREIVRQSKEKTKIEQAVRCFIPELLRNGYIRDEVYHNAKKYLLSKTTDPKKSLEEFLEFYDTKQHAFSVYFLFNKRIQQFQKILESHLLLDFSVDEKTREINPHEDYLAAKLTDIKALDFSGAANLAISRIELFLNFYRCIGNYGYDAVLNDVWVCDSKKGCQKIKVNREKYKSIEYDDHTTIGKVSETIISNMIISARCSLGRMEEIVKIHNRAISNNGLENGLLNMWSILEMICVTDQKGNKGAQVNKQLTPILQKDYMVTIFEDIQNNLKVVLSKEQYESLLSKIDENLSSDVEKIAMFLLLEKYETQVDDFVDCLINYPVLRSRILNIRDHYHKRSKFYYVSERYSQRVSWHLNRIYRARNTITHTGKTPYDLKDLGEHLHSYVDCIILELLVQLSRGSLCSITNVLIDSQLRRERLFNNLKKEEPFSVDDVKLIFDNTPYCQPTK